MDGKKKRGCNFTAEEKKILLDLIRSNQHIIENKETNANMILKKRETWDTVCQQYNAVAVSGCRKWQQLRHLYENLKQKSKKNIAKINREKYYENTKEVQKKASIDKKEMSRTGGGAYKSILTEQDAQILAMAAPQIQPLPNPYDDAALYFGDAEKDNEDESQLIVITTNKTDDQNRITSAAVGENNECCMTYNTVNSDDQEPTITVYENKQKSQSSTSIIRGRNIPKRNTKERENNIKLQYFKTKLRNAKLENKYIINKNKMDIAKHKIEMEILKLKLNRIKHLTKRKY